MWRVGQDATLRMTLGALLIVDRPPTPGRVARTVGVRRRSGASVATATRRPDRRAGPTCLGRRRRSGRGAPPAVPVGRRARVDAPGARPRGPARGDPVRSSTIAVGRHADRGSGGRTGCAVPALAPCAHRRRRRAPARRATARRAVVAACRREGEGEGECSPEARDRRAASTRTDSDRGAPSPSPSTSGDRCAGSSTASMRLVRSRPSSRPCAACSGGSTSPTPCRAS